MKIRTLVTTLAALTIAGTAAAQGGIGGIKDKKLEAGSNAPALNNRGLEWIKGDEVKEFEEGRVYVVEFWATWCAPCMRSIPHLSKLQKELDNVTIIGISDEKPSIVRPFVQKMGYKMDYTVVADENGRMKRSWMRPAGLNGIPAAFIIDGSKKIAWIGNPLDENFDRVLNKVANGRYDAVAFKAAEPMMEQVKYSRKMEDWRVCYRYLEEVIDTKPRVFNDLAMKRFKIQVLEQKDTEGAAEYTKTTFLETYGDDAEAIALLARMILTDAAILRSDEALMKELALELAEAAYQIDKGDPVILSVLAMANFNNENLDQAVKLARNAYFKAEPRFKAEYRKLLEHYQKASKSDG